MIVGEKTAGFPPYQEFVKEVEAMIAAGVIERVQLGDTSGYRITEKGLVWFASLSALMMGEKK